MQRIKQFLHRSPWISASIIFGVTAIAIGVVYALGTVSTGWQVNSGTPATVDLLASYSDCRVVTAPSGKSVFIPTKTATEWNRFKSGATAAGITVAACTYNWVVGSWGSCSVSCGGGTQTRSVTCQRVSDSVTVADGYCTGVKPATSQSCNTSACFSCPDSGNNCEWQSPAMTIYCMSIGWDTPFFSNASDTYRYGITGRYYNPSNVYNDYSCTAVINYKYVSAGGAGIMSSPATAAVTLSCSIYAGCTQGTSWVPYTAGTSCPKGNTYVGYNNCGSSYNYNSPVSGMFNIDCTKYTQTCN